MRNHAEPMMSLRAGPRCGRSPVGAAAETEASVRGVVGHEEVEWARLWKEQQGGGRQLRQTCFCFSPAGSHVK